MIRLAILAAAGVALSFVLPAPAPAHQVTCAPRADALTKLEATFGERRTWFGLDRGGWLVEMFTGANGSWTLIGTPPDKGLACVLSHGKDATPVPRKPTLKEEPAT